MIRVLIVDDEVRVGESFGKQLTEQKMRVFTAAGAREAFSVLEREEIDIVVLDTILPDMDGVELLLRLKERMPAVEAIMLTRSTSVATAIRSMKLGASDYLMKPCRLSDLSKAITKAYENRTRMMKAAVREEIFRKSGPLDDFIGTGGEMTKVRGMISLVAPSRAPVLLLGETGTGKELAARAIHDRSPRSGRPFVVINSSALQETMCESELFGCKRGAFTGAERDREGLIETADHGTFFVDEVGDMGLPIQAKVLRALETGTFRKIGGTEETTVDVRFIFATNKHLGTEVAEGRFRQDLYFRINTFLITLPPLRLRKGDIPELINYFLGIFPEEGRSKSFSREAMELLTAYEWPGNVRELANAIKRSFLMSGNRGEIVVDDLPKGIVNTVSPGKDRPGFLSGRRILRLAEMQEGHIQRVLHSVKGNKTQAARLLGISRTALYDKLGAIQAGR
jgi:DNA-binding NtrC family response regulator